MARKILIQTGLVLLVALALFISYHSHIPALEQGADTILEHMKVSYSAEDVKNALGKTGKAMASAAGGAGNAVGAMIGRPSYGEPIDKEYTGNRAAVYAVGGGQVTAAGENEEIGKYIRITHGDVGESLYGNLKEVKAEVPSKVKKGQIIGIYEKNSDREFYYSFREFR